jgi:hypothetical protein
MSSKKISSKTSDKSTKANAESKCHSDTDSKLVSIVGLASKIEIPNPEERIKNCKTKEDYDVIFKEYNQYFLDISNERDKLEEIAEKISDHIKNIYKPYKQFVKNTSDEIQEEDHDEEEEMLDIVEEEDDTEVAELIPVKESKTKKTKSKKEEVKEEVVVEDKKKKKKTTESKEKVKEDKEEEKEEKEEVKKKSSKSSKTSEEKDSLKETKGKKKK